MRKILLMMGINGNCRMLVLRMKLFGGNLFVGICFKYFSVFVFEFFV